jgi:hypothetical protein
VANLRALSDVALHILAEARTAKRYGAAMAGIGQMTRICELIAKLTGELDESARVNVLIAEREQREAGQVADLMRLDLAERLELQRLLLKAQGANQPPAALPVPATAVLVSQWTGGGPVKLGDIDLNLLSRINAEDSLTEFVRQAWHVVEPKTPLRWNWQLAPRRHLRAPRSGGGRRHHPADGECAAAVG